MQDTRGLLALVYAVALLDLMAASMIISLLSTYLRDELHLSATLSGLVTSLYGFVQFFSSPIVGGECDIRGYKKIMTLTCLALAPSYWLLTVKNWTVILLSRLLCGGLKHTQNLCKSVVGAYLPHKEQLQVFGRINAMGNVGFIVGPFLSGHLADAVGYEGVFIGSGCGFLACALLIHLFFPPESSAIAEKALKRNGGIRGANGDPAKPTSILGEIKQIDWSRHWDLFFSRFVFSFAVLVYRSNFSFLMAERYGLDKVWIGYLTSYQGVVSFLVSFGVDRLTSCFTSVAACYVWLQGATVFALLALIRASTLAAFTLSITCLCVCSSVLRATSYDLTTDRAGPEEMGLLMGVVASSTSVGCFCRRFFRKSRSKLIIARAGSPALGGFLHDLDRNAPAYVAVIGAAAGFAVSYFYTITNSKVYKVKQE